ncbi:MAG: hypothetical protein ABIS50_08455 [Luteolibacter sp.]|uniref:hypothetical protein n=1 Tax=Luteolibacter sp. TaxID=1962973 RepID=UPI00326615BE
MKPIPLVLLALMASFSPVRSEDENSAIPGVPTASILGDLQDGTPPAPEAPKPGFIVPAEDVLDTRTIEQGGRTITVQKINPIEVPEPTVSAPAVTESTPEVKARMAAIRAQHPRDLLIRLGATVYLSNASPPRTLASYWPDGAAQPVKFWSSADFALLSGLSSFSGSDGQTCMLMMMWDSVDIDRMTGLLAQQGRTYAAPEIPAFPTGNATFQITAGQPDAKSLAAIQSLHDLYNNEHERLLAAFQGREQARLQQEAELKAHPPQPKDIVLNYWLTETPAPAAKGGDQ